MAANFKLFKKSITTINNLIGKNTTIMIIYTNLNCLKLPFLTIIRYPNMTNSKYIFAYEYLNCSINVRYMPVKLYENRIPDLSFKSWLTE